MDDTIRFHAVMVFWILESTIVFKSGLNTYTVLPSAYGSKATKPFMHALLNRLSCQSS